MFSFPAIDDAIISAEDWAVPNAGRTYRSDWENLNKMDTNFSLLSIELPIIQAPIGRCASPALAAAVSRAVGRIRYRVLERHGYLRNYRRHRSATAMGGTGRRPRDPYPAGRRNREGNRGGG